MTPKLRQREAYLAAAQRLSHTGSFGWNVSTDEHFWSDETFRIFEFAPSSKVSMQMILDCVHPQDLASVNMAIATANRAEGIDLEFRLLMPDGRIKYLHVVATGERDETGSIEVVGAIMNITERKVAEETIRRSEAYLVQAQRLSHTGSFGWNVSTDEHFWSDETFRIFECDPKTTPTLEIVLSRVHPDDRELVQQQIDQATRDGAGFDFEHR